MESRYPLTRIGVSSSIIYSIDGFSESRRTLSYVQLRFNVSPRREV